MSGRRRSGSRGNSRRRSVPPVPPGLWLGQLPDDEPDLVLHVRQLLADENLYGLLLFVSGLLAVLDPGGATGPSPPWDDPEDPEMSTAEMVTSLIDIDIVETTALLTVFAELVGDEVLAARIRRALASRHHRMPRWLERFALISVVGATEVFDVLGDGASVIVGLRGATAEELTVVVFIDHNLGTVATDAVVLDVPMHAVRKEVGDSAASDVDLMVVDLDIAAARTRVVEAVDVGRITYPPFESNTWPGCRPLVEWVVRQLPTGGPGYQTQSWGEQELAELTRAFLSSSLGQAHDDADGRQLLDHLLWFANDYGTCDPLQWSPSRVELLLADWLPRKVVADADFLAGAPDLLRSFIRFSHTERDIRPELTDQTLAAVDELEEDYQAVIRLPRLQGIEALMAASGFNPSGVLGIPGLGDSVLDRLAEQVGGTAELQSLDAVPLPDEPFAWESVAADIAGRVRATLALVDRVCDDLLDTEYRTACRRLLNEAATADPAIFRRRGSEKTAAAAIVWLIGKANHRFPFDGGPGPSVGELMAHFGVSGSPTQRAKTMVRALGLEWSTAHQIVLGSPRYLVAERRRRIIAERDLFSAHVDPDQVAHRHSHAVTQAGGSDSGDGAGGPSLPGVGLSAAWFPLNDFTEALQRWPELAEWWGTDDYAIYARLLQGHLVDTAQAVGQHPQLVPIDVDELVRFAKRHGTDPSQSATHTALGADVARRGEAVAWPPGRNAPCWCGSGRKYKKCCGTVAVDPARRDDPIVASSPTTAYEFDVHLTGVSPAVWRRLRIKADATFGDFHRAIQHACGWMESHLFAFHGPDGRAIAGSSFDDGWGDPDPDAEVVSLAGFFERNDICRYTYDFGDNWEHDIVVRQRIDQAVGYHRRLIDGARAFPPEECGGLYGYEQCVQVATGGPDEEDLAAWMGNWDPEAFDLGRHKRHFDY